MRKSAWALAVAMLLAPVSAAWAQSEPLHAGITRFRVRAAVPFDVVVWYPTEADDVPWQVGPFLLPGTHDADVAPGRYPIILLSHGGGTAGGSPLMLGDISAALARHGFVVVAPFHGNRAPATLLRPAQMGAALAAVLADPRFKDHGDANRLGMLGFSLGGAVTLRLAGAVPNPEHFSAYCADHPEDLMTCVNAPGGAEADATGRQTAPPDETKPLPLKALVLLDPLSAIYDRDGLAAVTMPVLIYRPAQSALGESGNALALKADLPRPPRYEVISGSHFVFTDGCPPAILKQSPLTCQDPPGVNRAGVHARIAPQIVGFFQDTLPPPPPPAPLPPDPRPRVR